MNHNDRISQRGSALLLTLLVVSLLLVIVLSFVVFVRIQLREVTNHQNLAIARQNAKLGLSIAVSQLQKYAGADQRVTFPATTVLPEKDVDSSSGELYTIFRNRAGGGPRNTYLTPGERDDFNSDLKNWWQNRHPRWFGVGNSSLRKDATEVSPYQYGEFLRDQDWVWLVSGNESLDPGDSGYISPETAVGNPDSNPDWVWLVKAHSATLSDDSVDGMDGRVMARRTSISNSGDVGYAYWVSDESTKANFSAKDPFAGAIKGSLEYFNRLLLPQRFGWERLPGFEGVAGGNPDDPNNPLYPRFEKALNIRQLELADPSLTDDVNARGPLPRNFHGLTSFSKNLYTDTNLGGFRKDLTVFIDDPGNTSLYESDSILDPTLYSSSDPRFGSGNTGFPNTTTQLPAWGKIRSWYDNTGDTSNSAEVVPDSDINNGVYPVVTMFKFHMGLSIDPADGRVYLRYFPVVTLWNPFDAPLKNTTYDLELGLPLNVGQFSVNYQVQGPAPIAPVDDKYLTSGANPWAKAELEEVSGSFGVGGNSFQRSWDMRNVMRPLRAQITTDFQPGELLVFALSSDKTYVDSSGSPVALDNYYQDLTNLGASGGAPYGILIPTPFQVDFALSPTYGGVGDPIPSDIQDIRFRLVVWNNAFRQTVGSLTDLLKLDPTAEDQTPKPTAPGFMSDGQAYATLFANGKQLFRYAAGSYNQNQSTKITLGALLSGDARYAATNLDKWRELYTHAEFESRVPGTDVLLADEHVLGLSDFARFEGLFPQNSNFLSATRREHIVNIHRWFASYNPSASVWEMNPSVDLPHASFEVNSPDGFAKPTLYKSINSLDKLFYGQNLATEVNGRTRGYFFTEMVRDSSSQFSEVTQYAIRNLRRPEAELVSLGQLSQVGLSWMFSQPLSVAGNSEASPYVDREHLSGITSRTVAQGTAQWTEISNNSINETIDLSYLINESLWDRYYLSTIPQSGPFVLNQDLLANSRNLFVENGLNSIGDARDFDNAARYLYNEGALNLNSTSVESWVALLTSFRNLELESETGDSNPSDSMPVVNTLRPLSESVAFTEDGSSSDPATYGANGTTNRDITPVVSGFRYLSDEMINSLAERIVDEVKLRGPFFSISDFVNRRLVSPDRDSSDWEDARTESSSTNTPGIIGNNYDPVKGMMGLNGALQRAINLSGINGGVNHPGHNLSNDRVFNTDHNASVLPAVKRSDVRYYLDSEHTAGAPVGENGHILANTPGFVSQGNLLSMIGSALSARGDTFLVRAYGDTKGGSRTWIEAVIQRNHEYVDAAQSPETVPVNLNPVNLAFGRKFNVISLRYLQEDEL